MSGIRPFRIEATETELEDLRRRLLATRWPEPEKVDDWSQGVPLSYLKDVIDYWARDYDWRSREAQLNRFPQYKTRLADIDIHFIHVRSAHEHALPLLMTHGWPGSWRGSATRSTSRRAGIGGLPLRRKSACKTAAAVAGSISTCHWQSRGGMRRRTRLPPRRRRWR